jgi:hypothetical protein
LVFFEVVMHCRTVALLFVALVVAGCAKTNRSGSMNDSGPGPDGGPRDGAADSGPLVTCDGGAPAGTWFLDCDGDGYAPINAAEMVACFKPVVAKATVGCQGTGDAPWTLVPPVSGARDCAPENADARPGQTQYFENAITGTDFDYNCDDNNDDRRYQSVGSCGSGCSTNAGWHPTLTPQAPPCGVLGNFMTLCADVGGGCQPNTYEARKQSCR